MCICSSLFPFTASVSALEVLSWVSVGFSFVACGMTTETFGSDLRKLILVLARSKKNFSQRAASVEWSDLVEALLSG